MFQPKFLSTKKNRKQNYKNMKNFSKSRYYIKTLHKAVDPMWINHTHKNNHLTFFLNLLLEKRLFTSIIS